MVRRALLFCLALLPLAAAFGAPAGFREITWEELIPKGWDPARDLKSLDLSKLQDADPRAMDALQKLRDLWDNAPVETALDGAKVRLPGFAIPLDRQGEKVTQFLLVPYFGACIHSPPPPSNQILLVVSKKPLPNLHSMDTVWVNGTLSLQRADTPWGKAGYRLTLESMENYMPAPPAESKKKK
jgi:hypothetical protein